MKTILFSTSGLLVLVALVVFLAITITIAKTRSRSKPTGKFIAHQVTTANEQKMFWRLVEYFPQPEFVVLAQVSFGALLYAKDGATRNSFSQKIADFVLLDKTFKVLAVIELDDSSHKGKEDQDAKRDAMLTKAGYRILRYSQTPNSNRLLNDINDPPLQEK